MVKLTLIARVRDGLPLAEGLDNDRESELFAYKSQAKAIFKKIASSYPSTKPAPRVSIDAGKYVFHYVTDANDVIYMTLTDKQYPKKLAYGYLDELAKEFGTLYGAQVDSVTRPYAFIKFDSFIQKSKKVYLDSRTQKNMERLNADLAEVHQIMTQNIADVLGQGQKLDRMTEMSNVLSHDAKQLAVKAKVRTVVCIYACFIRGLSLTKKQNLLVPQGLYHQALIKKYLPWIVIFGTILLVMFIRLTFY